MANINLLETELASEFDHYVKTYGLTYVVIDGDGELYCNSEYDILNPEELEDLATDVFSRLEEKSASEIVEENYAKIVELISTKTPKEVEIYESPKKEANEERYGNDSDSCVCCAKRTVGKYWIHANTNWRAIDTEETDNLPSGMESQGFFPVGPSCKKKFPPSFIFESEPVYPKGWNAKN